jgi:GT2 family glycosyltransferase
VIDVPHVSVVLPTRNRRRLVMQAIACALAQRDVRVEVLVVDEGSSDGTPEALAAMTDPRIRVLRNDVPAGVARARNAAIEQARAEWVAFLDDDDLWAPAWLATALEVAGRTGAGVVYGGRVMVDGDRRATGSMLPPAVERVGAELQYENVLGGPSVVVARTAAVREAGGFDPGLLGARGLAPVARAPSPRDVRRLPRAAGRLHEARDEHASDGPVGCVRRVRAPGAPRGRRSRPVEIHRLGGP